MRVLPHATAELIASLQEIAEMMDQTIGEMDPAISPVSMVQGRVYAATCRLAAARLEELAYLIEELVPDPGV
jgi:hypothetical protein